MKAAIVAPIELINFSAPDKNKYNEPYKIYNGKEVVKHLRNDFVFWVGNINMILIESNYNFYFTINGVPADINLRMLADKFLRTYSTYVETLWFIKGSNAFVNRCYAQNLETGEVGDSTLDAINCDSQDSCATTTFTPLEIMDFGTIWDAVNNLRVKPKNAAEDLIVPNVGVNTMTRVASNFLVYNHCRISRALLFLSSITSTGIIINKISLTMSLYECLFTSSEVQVGKQIRKRLSSFIGVNKADKKVIIELIFKAYDIRSRYVHGDIIEHNPDIPLRISKSLDEITRRVMNKIIFMTEDNIFNQDDSPENKLKFEAFFNELSNTHFTDAVKGNLVNPMQMNKIVFRDEYK